MDESMNMAVMPEMTEEEKARMEAEAEANREAVTAPYKAAAKQRQQSADVIAEHDNLLADMLFEMTMNAFGEEV